LRRADHAVGLRRGGRMVGDDVAHLEELVKVLDPAYTQLARTLLGEIGIVDENLAAEWLEQANEGAPGHAGSDEANALEIELMAKADGIPIRLPLLGVMHRIVELVGFALRHERDGERPLPHRIGNHTRRMRYS